MSVNVSSASGRVRQLVMSNKVNFVLGQKVIIQRPRGIFHHLIDVSAMPDSLVALILVHNSLALPGVGELVTANADQQVHFCVGKHIFGLE